MDWGLFGGVDFRARAGGRPPRGLKEERKSSSFATQKVVFGREISVTSSVRGYSELRPSVTDGGLTLKRESCPRRTSWISRCPYIYTSHLNCMLSPLVDWRSDLFSLRTSQQWLAFDVRTLSAGRTYPTRSADQDNARRKKLMPWLRFARLQAMHSKKPVKNLRARWPSTADTDPKHSRETIPVHA